MGVALTASQTRGADESAPQALIQAGCRDRLLEVENGRIVDRFISASQPALMYYYQLFWPVFIRDGGIERLAGLADVCESRLRARDPRTTTGRLTTHRARALPAIAAAHALGFARGDEASPLQEGILRTLTTALDDDPHRIVLEAAWQGLTAALVRNASNWQELEAHELIVAQAERLCERYLAQDEPILLFAAAAAWQFLLTYERALLERREAGTRLLERVRAALAHIHGRSGSPRFVWLTTFEFFYRSRVGYPSMLPQYSEIIMMRPRLAATDPVLQIADFLVLMRLEMIHVSHQIAEGQVSSVYMRDVKRSGEGVGDSLAFLRDYAVGPGDRARLKQLARVRGVPLSTPTLEALDRLAVDADDLPVRSTEATWCARLVPFREYEEQEVARHAHRCDSPESAARVLSSAPGGVVGLIGLWLTSARFAASAQLTRRDLFVKGSVITEEDLEECAVPYVPLYEEIQERSIDSLRSIHQIPAGPNRAGAGMGPSVGNVANTMPHSELDWDQVDEIGRRARSIYSAQLQEQLEASSWGKFVAIDVASGDFIVAADLVELINRYKAQFGSRAVWTTRIGDPIHA